MTVVSRRIAGIQPPIVPIVSRWIDEAPGTISLGQGVVAYGPPPEAMAALESFGTSADDHRYGPVEGSPAFIEAIERKLATENRILVRPGSRVFVTAGSNMAFQSVLHAITSPGDEVILPAPYYFNHEMAVAIAGASATAVPTTDSYHLDLSLLAAAVTPRTRAIVTVSPNNPAGVVYPAAALAAVNDLCRARGLVHIHDEAYEYFTADGAPPFSPGSLPGAAAHTVSLFSLSKAYGMASWRVGYMVVPAALEQALETIQDTVLISPPAITQYAALAALGVGRRYADGHRPAIDRVRACVDRALSRESGALARPSLSGAFYAFLRVPTSLDSMALIERLIRDHRVAVLPGSAFGVTDACALRLSYGALDEATVAEGMRRLVEGLGAICADRPGRES